MNVRNYGIYNLQFSAQLVNTDVQIHDIDVWFRKNGTNIASSNSRYSVPNSHGGVDGHIIADDEVTAKNQLDEKGGIVTKRDVKLVNSTVLYGEDKDK